MQHHHLLIRYIGVAPRYIGIHRHLNPVDAGRRYHRAALLHDEQVVGVQRRTGRIRRGVYAADPAYGGLAALLIVMDMLIDRRNVRDILFGAFSDHGKSS